MFRASSCIWTKVSLRNLNCNILLQLSKEKRGSVISGIVGRESIEFMREHPSRNPHVGSLHRFRARSYENTLESLHLHRYILTLPGLGGGGGEEGGLVAPRLTFVVYIPRTKNVEALRLNDFS